MATAILLYNGLHFPGAIADKGIAWATASGGNLLALFLLSDKEQDEGYPFPSDLGESEEITTDGDAMGQDLVIIASNMRLIRHQAKNARIKLQTQILPSVPKNVLHSWLEKGDHIFVSADPIDPPVLSIDPSKIKTSLEAVNATVEWFEE